MGESASKKDIDELKTLIISLFIAKMTIDNIRHDKKDITGECVRKEVVYVMECLRLLNIDFDISKDIISDVIAVVNNIL